MESTTTSNGDSVGGGLGGGPSATVSGDRATIDCGRIPGNRDGAPKRGSVIETTSTSALVPGQKQNGHGGARAGAGRKTKGPKSRNIVDCFLRAPQKSTDNTANNNSAAETTPALPTAAPPCPLESQNDSTANRPASTSESPAVETCSHPAKSANELSDATSAKHANIVQDEERILQGLEQLEADAANPGCDGSLDSDDDDESNYSNCSDDDWDNDAEFGLDDGEPDENGLPEHVRKIRRLRQKYKPAHNSPLQRHLAGLKSSINGKLQADVRRGMSWCAPTTDPLSCSLLEPEQFYKSNFWAYIFLPHDQYSHLCGPPSSFCCIYCGKSGKLESKGLHYRPMFDFGKIVWLIHRRRQCNHEGCRRTFAEIHPLFLKQLPTIIVERFPFITTAAGFGVHRMVMRQFLALSTKGTWVGSFTQAYNEMLRVQHSMDHLSYLDFVHHRLLHGIQTTKFPPTFSAFAEPGEYSCISMPKGLLRTLFHREMAALEPYMQKSFQTVVDEGMSSDHTFKYAKKILSLFGKIFAASWSILTLFGKVAMSRLTFTTSNFEIRLPAEEHKKVRILAGQPVVRRYEGDGGGDRALILQLYSELKDGTTPFEPVKIDGLPRASIDEDAVTLILTRRQANEWACSILESINIHRAGAVSEPIVFGLDAEWNMDETNDLTRCLQLAFPSYITNQVAVIHLSAMDVFEADDFPEHLRSVLQLPSVVAAGVNVAGDICRLERLGVKIGKTCELRRLGGQLRKKLVGGYSLKSLCAEFLQVGVDKAFQSGENWSQSPLPLHLVQYAALDAKLHLDLAIKMRQLASNNVNASIAFRTGDQVNILARGKICARATVEFVGGVDGAQHRWGDLCVGEGKCMVRLDEIVLPSAKPPFYFQPTTADSGLPWNKGTTTLGQIMTFPPDQRVIAVPVSQLMPRVQTTTAKLLEKLQPSNDAMLDGTHDGQLDGAGGPTGSSEHIDEIDDEPYGILDFDSLETGPDPIEFTADNDLDERDALRSREKSDIFHVMDALPLPRKCPERSILSRLLIHATFEMEADDYENVVSYLFRSKKVMSHSHILVHFYFNREWWRQRVRMAVRPAARHAAALHLIHDFIKTHIPTIYDDKLEAYLKRFENLAQFGKFEEVDDVEIFTWHRCDRNGLDVYLRNRGSRAENYHQKMSTLFGPHSVGPQTAHYLLVLMTYKYNISVGIHRRREHDFGHWYHHIIDRIQHRTQQIYGYNLYPDHKNVTLAETLPNHVAVGIGPLCYENDYVETGGCHESLTGDLRFIAKQMGVVLPPLPVATVEEKKIFNVYVQSHPVMKDADFRTLARQFKDRADGKRIFPKLPTLLKSYYNNWKDNRLMEAATSVIAQELDRVLEQLTVPLNGKTRALASGKPNEIEALYANMDLEVGGEESLLPVPPSAAPDQEQFVAVNQHVSRRCFYFPRCLKQAHECGGWIEGKCSGWDSNALNTVELAEKKRELRKERKRVQTAAQRAEKKRSRQALNGELQSENL